MFRPHVVLERKSTLFSAIVAGVVATLALPVIIPHLLHGFHIAHILLHVGGLILAMFITVLAGLAYSRMKTKRLMFSTAAFACFILAEVVLVIDVTWPYQYYFGDVALNEIGHLLVFATLGLLAMGVFRND